MITTSNDGLVKFYRVRANQALPEKKGDFAHNAQQADGMSALQIAWLVVVGFDIERKKLLNNLLEDYNAEYKG